MHFICIKDRADEWRPYGVCVIEPSHLPTYAPGASRRSCLLGTIQHGDAVLGGKMLSSEPSRKLIQMSEMVTARSACVIVRRAAPCSFSQPSSLRPVSYRPFTWLSQQWITAAA